MLRKYKKKTYTISIYNNDVYYYIFFGKDNDVFVYLL